MVNEELYHYKNECLVLAIALRKATNLIAINDSDYSAAVFDFLIKKAREEIATTDQWVKDYLIETVDV